MIYRSRKMMKLFQNKGILQISEQNLHEKRKISGLTYYGDAIILNFLAGCIQIIYTPFSVTTSFFQVSVLCRNLETSLDKNGMFPLVSSLPLKIREI